MNKSNFKIILITFFFLSTAYSQQIAIDNFENLDTWNKIASDGANINLSVERDINNKCFRIDYKFTGAGYCGIEKIFPFNLPDNYKFTFTLKGESPKNNLEFKLVDKSGDNVWWRNQRNFEFPENWQKVTVKKRDIEFAWGPVGGGEVNNFERIQIIIAASEGGKGTIYLDDLFFEEIILPQNLDLKPTISSSNSKDINLNYVIDSDLKTTWRSQSKPENQSLFLDLQYVREIGGLVLHWHESEITRDFNIAVSNDRVKWETIFSVNENLLAKNFVHLKDIDARYIKINLTKSLQKKGYALKEIEIKGPSFSQNLNEFFTNIAGYYKEGCFPKYFLNKQSYWTVLGVSEDLKEALINEQGAVEVDKSSFSLEPFIQLGDKLITWNDVTTNQFLEKKYLPIPSVNWLHKDVTLKIIAVAEGEPGNSNLLVKYKLINNSARILSGKLFITIRPFQVNPKWQFLNNEGGISKIKEISYSHNIVKVNNNKSIVPLTKADNFGAVNFVSGEIIDYLTSNSIPKNQFVKDEFGFASGCLSYNFQLKPGDSAEYVLAVPFHQISEEIIQAVHQNPSTFFNDKLKKETEFWEEKLDRIKIQLPQSAEKIIQTLKTNLGYILINKDGPAIQPGSRSYERSWMRDGALTSSALLRLGLKDEVKNYLNWFSLHQFSSGKIPCVVDKRGADPTPENDSHGEYIYAILQYYKFTKDTSFLREKLQNIIGAVNYIEFLTIQRKTEQYKKTDSTVFWGLMPESISHEGYSAKPMHSYWDDFFTIRGLRDAVEIAQILNEVELTHRFEKLRDDFERNLLSSINLAIKNHNIEYIPGCAELGDFDATSTTIALFPGNEQKRLPQKELFNTFEKYYSNSISRMEANSNWINYTPYELRVIGSFIYLNQKERAHKMLDFFFNDQRPDSWNHWAEVVWKNINEPRFIGDMPHTWVGSDYINSIRIMFVYEDDLDSTLVLGAGLKEEWLNSPEGINITNLPTYYGNISYSVKNIDDVYEINISGDIEIPKNKIIFKNFKDNKPSKVIVNEIESINFDQQNIFIDKIPAKILLTF